VVEEAATRTPGEECAADVEGEGEEAAEKADAGDAFERRPSSNSVERVKRRGRTRKLAPVRLSPYRSTTSRRYIRQRRRGVMSGTSKVGRAGPMRAESSTKDVEHVEDIAPIATDTSHMQSHGSPLPQQAQVRQATQCCKVCTAVLYCRWKMCNDIGLQGLAAEEEAAQRAPPSPSMIGRDADTLVGEQVRQVFFSFILL